MKTAIKTLFATALTAIVLTSSAFTTFAKDADKTPSAISAVSGFNMIKVTGHVTVYLTQGTKEKIRVESEDQNESKVSFKREGKKLLISSEDGQTATVYLTVKDLQRIEASEQSIVKSTGRFNLPVLQIFLKDNAKADVNVTAQDVYTVVVNPSSIKLSGCADRHISVKNDASTLNVTRFAAVTVGASQPVFATVDLDAQFAETTNLIVVAPGRTAK